MLTKLRFKNFKAWSDSGEIRFAPLTVFFGINSAGKSSIQHLLLLLKQTAESSDRQRPLHFGDTRTRVDLGSFKDMLHQHHLNKPFEFTLQWTLDKPLRVQDQFTEKEYVGDAIEFAAVLKADTRGLAHPKSLKYTLKAKSKQILDVELSTKGDTGSYALNSKLYRFRRNSGKPVGLPEPGKFYFFPEEVMARYQNTAFVSDLVLEFEELLRSMFYLGPLREYPRRLYLWSGEIPEHVGDKGERVIEAILAAKELRFNRAPKVRGSTLEQLVAEQLQNMAIIENFRINRLGKDRKEYEVLVRTNAGLPEVKLTDVGFGVSQILPVVVESYYVPHRSIVIFEQPEIHLHPRVQADLADLFIDALNIREGGKEKNCQFIVESHSEHLLRRLQRRIAEGKIPSTDAALYFVDIKDGAAHVSELDVDTYGNITNWPQDFFGDELGDLVARSEAQAERMSRGTAS